MMRDESVVQIVHEDPDFVVVEKASGFLSVPGRGPEKSDCVCARIRERYPHCIPNPEVHRLDMDTSGLMVLALKVETQRHLSEQFRLRRTRKRYTALLDGELEGDRGTIELKFRLDLEDRPRQIHDPEQGKLGVTHWERVAIEGGITRVFFVPVTGRTHQLRVHSAHELGLGIPIVGDPLYGRGTGPGQLKLHACELGFEHPRTGELIAFQSHPRF